MKKLGLFLVSFLICGLSSVYALENDVARVEMPSQDANLTSDSLHTSPTEQPPIPSGPSNYTGDTEGAHGGDEVASEETSEQDAEIEVFVPKGKRHVWKDEAGSTVGENGSASGGSKGSYLTDKLNKISSGGTTQ